MQIFCSKMGKIGEDRNICRFLLDENAASTKMSSSDKNFSPKKMQKDIVVKMFHKKSFWHDSTKHVIQYVNYISLLVKLQL
jgi:predicted peptidase